MAAGRTSSAPSGRARPARTERAAADHQRRRRMHKNAPTQSITNADFGVSHDEDERRRGQAQQPRRPPSRSWASPVSRRTRKLARAAAARAQTLETATSAAPTETPGSSASPCGRPQGLKERSEENRGRRPRNRAWRSPRTSRRPNRADPGGPWMRTARTGGRHSRAPGRPPAMRARLPAPAAKAPPRSARPSAPRAWGIVATPRPPSTAIRAHRDYWTPCFGKGRGLR